MRYQYSKKAFTRTVRKTKEAGITKSISKVCKLFGYRRQSYYKRLQIHCKKQDKEQELLNAVHSYRSQMPRLGGRKLLHLLTLKGLNYGRDKFFDLLRVNNLLVKRHRSYQQTTNSRHWLRRYPNLIKDLQVTQVEQVWVSDITYLQTEEGFAYLSLITDLYSRKIMGYDLSRNLKSEGAIRALKMAITNRKTGNATIHHSDRGLQYCSAEYQKILRETFILPSMTENSDPYENALAERMNGILKTEFFLDIKFPSTELAKKAVKEVVEIYNTQRPHCSLKMKTPEQIHEGT